MKYYPETAAFHVFNKNQEVPGTNERQIRIQHKICVKFDACESKNEWI